MAKYVELGQGDNRNVDLTDVKLVKLLPETEQLVVEPTTETQNFKPSAEKYFDDVTISAIQTESLNVSPSIAEQSFNAPSGKFYNAVTVGAVTSDIDSNIQEYNIRKGVTILGKVGNVEVDKPDQEKIVNASITEDIVVVADTGYELAKVTIPKVDVSKYAKEEVSLDVTPSESEQVFTPSGNQVYNQVNIGAIPSDYVGSSIARVSEQSYVPTTTDIEIQANQFLSGKQTIKGDANLISENIAEGKEIFGILGTHQGGSVKFSELVQGNISEVTAQDLLDVTTIRDDVFANLEITKVEIPSKVVEIGDSAFANNEISSLTLNEGVQTIGASAFANNPITSLAIPNSVTTIGASAFGGTQITELDMSNQSNPPSVTSTTFPNTLTTIHVAYGDYDTYVSAWSDYADKIVRGLAIPSTITVTVNNYLGELVSGASVTITDGTNTYTGTTNDSGVYVQNNLQPATYTISVADLDGFETPEPVSVVVEENTQNSVTITYLEQTGTKIDPVFGNNSPEVISAVGDEIATKGYTSSQVEEVYGWKLGDTVSYTLSTGENVEMRIIGFNHDDLSSGKGKAGITLEMTHCLATLYKMRNDRYNFGGYASADVLIRPALSTIKTQLPQEWQDAIKSVNKKSTAGGTNTSVTTTSESLFLLSEIELCNTTTKSQLGAEEGVVYEYWKSSSARAKLRDANSDGIPEQSISYWLRSCAQGDNERFVNVSSTGTISTSYANNNNGVSFAFCVGSPKTFADYTPSEISAISAEISANNMTSAEVEATYGWKIGDTTSYQLTTGENVEMRIIGFNHDDLADGSGKAGITLEMTHCLATKYKMNSSSSNSGGYPTSVIKTNTIPTIKSTIPQEWQDVIKLVNKKSANGGGGYYTETLTTSEDLFLLAGVEVFGNESTQYSTDEGTQYEYWTGKVSADRVKTYDADGDGIPETASLWWLRSCRTTNTTDFCCVYTNGTLSVYSPTVTLGMSFCICV